MHMAATDVMSANVCLINEAEGRDQSNCEDEGSDQWAGSSSY